jgi:16S rRNA (guanine527-N7)-methyltransferase
MQKKLLEKFVDAVLAAPSSLSLTATTDPAEFWERHVLDALKLIGMLPREMLSQSLHVIDVGSGNGVPGIPVAIAVPNWQLSLLDSNNKKCGFIDSFCNSNTIKNVQLLPGRAEELGHQPALRESFDLGFARALGKLPTALELAAGFIKRGGRLIVPHGTSAREELQASKSAMETLGLVHQSTTPYRLNREVQFFCLSFLKHRSTPEEFPRKSGIPRKRPL